MQHNSPVRNDKIDTIHRTNTAKMFTEALVAASNGVSSRQHFVPHLQLAVSELLNEGGHDAFRQNHHRDD